MTNEREVSCSEVEERMAEILDGSAPEALFDHVADCDRCRDARHDAERAVELVGKAGADFRLPDELEARVLATLDAREGGDATRAADSGEATTLPSVERPDADDGDAGDSRQGDADDGDADDGDADDGDADDGDADDDAAHDEDDSEDRDGEDRDGEDRDGEDRDAIAAAHAKQARRRAAERRAAQRREKDREKRQQKSGKGLGTLLRLPKRPVIWGGVAALAAAAGTLVWLSGDDGPAGFGGSDHWSGKVAHVSQAGTGDRGLQACDPDGESCKALADGDPLPAGSRLRTDERTRAHVELADGTEITLDRSTDLALGDQRRAKLSRGGIVADVAHDRERRARFDLPRGFVEVLGTKFALRTSEDSTTVDVSRGAVRLSDEQNRDVTVRAGEEGRMFAGMAPYVSATANLGDALAWSESALARKGEPAIAHRGLGELRAKKPGEKQERQGAVSLTSHKVKVRIAGGVARTEVDETFTNETDEVLEGIYRFPLPPDAKIERLALETNGKLEEGAFVDRDRAAAIWRGAIVNAEPKARQQIREEIVWVPGPWRDPALLEWQRGGRFELRIYPIPKKGSRRVVLAYTQTVTPTAGVRHYTYPLAHDPSGSTEVGRFEVDVEVRGHDSEFGVRSRGYELTRNGEGEVARLSMQQKDFVPAGDLSVEYALPNRDAELTVWAYQPKAKDDDAKSAKAAKAAKADTKPADDDGVELDEQSPYVALALRPKLPRRIENAQRAFVVVVDASRSMFGESYERAVQVATRTLTELDPLDRATVLACDVTCRELPGGLKPPGPGLAEEAQSFLEGIDAEGASDVTTAIRSAVSAASEASDRDVRIVYIGDGTPTVGPIRPAYVTRAVREALPAARTTVTAVAIGSDSDLDTLGAVARGGRGTVLPYVPGETTAEAAYAVLGATYGSTLSDVKIALPDGLERVAPKEHDSIVGGSESIVVARMTKPTLKGTVRLSGKLGKQAFEQQYPVSIQAKTSAGNAFVPRLYAANRIADLEREPSAQAKKEAIELSSRFNVASRYTSLLVLESQAMFRAFGLDNSRTTPLWTGEEDAEGTSSRGLFEQDEDEGPLALGGAKKEAKAKDGFLDDDFGVGRASSGSSAKAAGPSFAPAARPRPKPRSAPEPTNPFGGSAGPPAAEAAPTERPQSRTAAGCAPDDLQCQMSAASDSPRFRPPPPRRRMIPMRRIWERKGSVVDNAVPKTASSSAIAEAEREVEQNENRRAAVRKLYTLYALAGDIEQAASVAERWSKKDPLDPDALTARADLAAKTGDRDRAIRILGSVVDVRPDDIKSQKRLARLHRWAGRPALGCRHSMAIAQLRSGDAELLAEAVECARETGESRLASDLLDAADDKTRRAAERELDKKDDDQGKLSGDLRIEADWSGDVDVDLALLHPDGHRVSWLGAPTRSVITATDVLSKSREGLALRGAKPGEYVIEVVRGSGTGTARGDIRVKIADTTRTLHFTLDGDRTVAGIARIRMQSRLVPLR